ncbi:hypothetical protein RMT89_26060, partial [Streptomyces sp. P17]|nr:hypothetical protein [Streptomyces sp. P17]
MPHSPSPRLPARHAPATHRTPDSEVITDWSRTAVEVVSVDARRPTAEPFIWYGFVSAAVYNAAVGIEGRYRPYKWNVRGPRDASSEAAAAAAARRVPLTYFRARPPGSTPPMPPRRRRSPTGAPRTRASPSGSGILPGSQARIDAAYAASPAKIPDGSAEDEGVA